MVPALAAVRAERMIAAESAIFFTLDIVLSPSFVGRSVVDQPCGKIGCPNRRLTYRLAIVWIAQRYWRPLWANGRPPISSIGGAAANPPLPAALVCRGIRRLLRRA